MSRSYTVNGDNVLRRCIQKASEESASIVAELSNCRISTIFTILRNLYKYNNITIVYNMVPDSKLKVQSDGNKLMLKVAYFHKRILENEIYTYGINSDLALETKFILDLMKSNKVTVLLSLNTTQNLQYIHFEYSNSTTRDIIADISNPKNEICTVIEYLAGENTLNNLVNQTKTKIKSSGMNSLSDISNVLFSLISIDRHFISDIYDKSLYEINKNHINTKLSQDNLLNAISKVELKFQSDGVNSLVSILLKYGIAYLADSVGLGKTIVTLRLLAKTGYKAVIVTPNELVENQWREYIYDSGTAEILNLNTNSIYFCIDSYQDLDKFIKCEPDYDLVIFDEAQNFRNVNTLRYKRAQEICAGKQVLLIGATPINNGIADMEAQLLLGLDDGKSYDFGVGPIGEYFASLKKMTSKSKKNSEEYKKAQRIAGNSIRQSIISKLMVRRTRLDIERYYKDDIDSGNLHFPTINDPILVKYKYNGSKLATTLDILSGYNYKYNLTYALYNPSRYLKNKPDDSENSLRELNMTGLTKTRLIKMLDSSPEAFINSVKNMMNKIEDTINYVEGYITKQQYQESLFEDEVDLKSSTKEYNDNYIMDLENDRFVLDSILKMWWDGNEVIDSDVKSNELLKIIQSAGNQKIVIFTEFVVTAQVLENKLRKLGYKVLKVDGTDNKTKSNEIRDNFSISGRMLNDYNILISTNVLSEGINLNRAAIAINYDITWNPTIITQRVGRLNRIDNLVREIKVYNFFPCDEMDTAILSESNIISKFALASHSIGTDENYLVSSNSLDTDISIMEYRQGIINSISKTLIDESIDFRTVDFRYADKANERFADNDSINNLKDYSMMSVSYTLDGETPGFIGIFSNNGRIITCKKDQFGLSYIDYNDFLDILKRHCKESKLPDIGFDFKDIEADIAKIRYQNTTKGILNEHTRALYNIVDKLEDGLEKSLESQKIDEINFQRKLDILEGIKFNILNGLINSYLAKTYKSEFVDTTKNETLNFIEQADKLINIIPNRLKSANKYYDIAQRFRIIAIIQLIREDK